MMNKKNFIMLIRVWGILFLVGLGAIFVTIDVIRSYSDLYSRSKQIRADYIDHQKETIKQEVIRVVDLIRNEKAQSESLTRRKIKSRIDEAYSIAQNIYQQNQATESKTRIQQMILDALRPIRFENGIGYYFATRMDGVEMLFSDKPEMEGLNLLDIQDTHGKHVIKDMIEIVKQSGEGFYEYQWTKPASAGKDFKKISYIKRFEPYDFFIGTGLYVDDVENGIKEDLLLTISRIRFGKEGYIFVNNLNGDALVSNGKIYSGTKKLWEVFNDDPEIMKDIFEKEHNAALKPEGDYIYYSWIKLTNSDEKSPKTSFVYGMPDLHWLVGAGAYLDDIETEVALMQAELTNQIKAKIVQYVLIVVGICGLFLLFFNLFNRRLKKDINLFISFFGRTVHSGQEIDRNEIRFVEFDQIAEYANKMLAERKQAEEALSVSETRLRLALAAAFAGIWEWDLKTNKNIWSDELYRLYDLDPLCTDASYDSWFQSIFPEDRAAVEAAVKSASTSESDLNIEWRVNTADGSTRWLMSRGQPHRSENGNVLRYLGIVVDITERKQAEEKLRETQAILQAAMDNSQAGIAIADSPSGSLRYVNDAGLLIRGGDRQSVVNGVGIDQYVASWQLMDLNGRPLRSDEVPLARAIMFGEISTREFIIRRKEGDDRIVWANASPITNDAGNITAGVVVFLDITERKRAEEELRASEALNYTIINNISQKLFLKDRNSVYCLVNKSYAACFGLKPEYFVGKDDFVFFPDELARKYRIDDLMVMESGLEKDIEEHFIANGKDFLVRTIKVPVRNDAGEVTSLLGIFEDITDRKQAEMALLESENKLRATLDATPFPTAVVDLHDDKIYFWSRSALTLFGHTATTAQEWYEIAYPDPDYRHEVIERWKPFLEIARGSGQPVNTGEYRITCKDGSVRICELYATFLPDNLIVTFNDITEQKKIQEQFIQAQKMESVGRLAGGVAHDFNNMLGIILGYTELTLDQVEQTDPLHANLQEIRKAANRSADLTRQLLAFARKQTIALKVLDLNETLEWMLKMLQRLIGENIDLAWLPGKNLWPVKLDPSQIDQILANLCVNARDSIVDAGKVTIETGNVTFDETYCADHFGFVPGEYVMLAVSDNGCGMDKEVLGNIFEPFFTTKELGQGSGLGLATVYGIVKQNSGFINVYSEPDQGTTFKIFLPRHMETGESEQKMVSSGVAATGNETILLVEDEKAILTMTSMMLERLGYTVLTASTPDQAISISQSYSSRIDLLLTDVVMPEMSGRNLAEMLLQLNPNLKCLYMSGYTANVIAHHGVLDKGVHFIHKPFSKQDLAAKLREAMEDAKTTAP